MFYSTLSHHLKRLLKAACMTGKYIVPVVNCLEEVWQDIFVCLERQSMYHVVFSISDMISATISLLLLHTALA